MILKHYCNWKGESSQLIIRSHRKHCPRCGDEIANERIYEYKDKEARRIDRLKKKKMIEEIEWHKRNG